MHPAMRWVIPVVVIVAIAIGWMLWNRSPEAPAPTPVAQQAPPPPPATQPAQPVTSTVLFDFDRSVLRPEDRAKLDQLISKLNTGGYDRIGAIGYADRIGPESYNLVLSQRRADAVSTYLTGKGVNYQMIRTEARGEGEPSTSEQCNNMGKASRKNRKLIECLQPDRRVLITVMVTK